VASRVVLIIRDSEYQTQVVRALRARGIGVDAFDSAAAVKSIYPPKVPWASALIDLHLPGENALQFAEWLQQQSPTTVLNFLSSTTDGATLSHAHRLGTVLWHPIGMGPLCEQFARQVRASGVYLKTQSPVTVPATADTTAALADTTAKPLKRRAAR
jgi:ActR/RegA family two-component response regulator